jgi:hypothetical protein
MNLTNQTITKSLSRSYYSSYSSINNKLMSYCSRNINLMNCGCSYILGMRRSYVYLRYNSYILQGENLRYYINNCIKGILE